MAIVITNIVQHFLNQVLNAGKRASLQDITRQKRKPDFNLVKPRSMKGKEMKNDSFIGFVKNLFSFLLGHFLPIQAADFGHKHSDFFGHMRSKIIQDQMNLDLRMFFQNQSQEFTKFFAAMSLENLAQYFAGLRIEGRKKSASPVTNVTKLPSQRLTGQHRFVGSHPLQRLHSRLLIDTKHDAIGRRFQIKPQDSKHLLFKERVGRVEPVSPPPRLQSRFLQPTPNRLDRNRVNDLLLDRRPAKLSKTPSFKSSSDLPGRFEDEFDKSMFLLRGKKRSELRDAVSLSNLSTDFSKSASAISGPYAHEFQVVEQSQHLKFPGSQAKSSWLLNNPEQKASESSTSFADAFSLRSLTQQPQHAALSLRSPRFLSEKDRLKPYTNLGNSVLVEFNYLKNLYI